MVFNSSSDDAIPLTKNRNPAFTCRKPIRYTIDLNLRNLIGQIETRDRCLPIFIGDGIYRPVEIAGCVVGRDDHRIDFCDIFDRT